MSPKETSRLWALDSVSAVLFQASERERSRDCAGFGRGFGAFFFFFPRCLFCFEMVEFFKGYSRVFFVKLLFC